MPAPRKSNARKSVNGTLRADRQPRKDYASRLTEPPEPPAELSANGRRIWCRLAAIATGVGVLTNADLPLLELLVATIEAEADARAAIAAEGVTVAAANGGRKGNPAAGVAEAARAQAVGMLRELGLTPRSRQTVDAAPLARGANPFEKYGRVPPDVSAEGSGEGPRRNLAEYLGEDDPGPSKSGGLRRVY